ncbi:hypothetical protein PUN28_004038 [Cardiocondyla obscurior]|uniref:Uncharacterized protein n=1 Tax=Cardiocondyla obscurior TaxID=286306 RepID=A0AAW2GNI3_9HYME
MNHTVAQQSLSRFSSSLNRLQTHAFFKSRSSIQIFQELSYILVFDLIAYNNNLHNDFAQYIFYVHFVSVPNVFTS